MADAFQLVLALRVIAIALATSRRLIIGPRPQCRSLFVRLLIVADLDEARSHDVEKRWLAER